jgi:hypothetical protein
MLTRILTWWRRVWREVTRPAEEPALTELRDKYLVDSDGLVRKVFVEPPPGAALPTFAELKASRRALLESYQPKPVRGPDPEVYYVRPPEGRVYAPECRWCHGTGSCDAGEDAGGNRFAEECSCWEGQTQPEPTEPVRGPDGRTEQERNEAIRYLTDLGLVEGKDAVRRAVQDDPSLADLVEFDED